MKRNALELSRRLMNKMHISMNIMQIAMGRFFKKAIPLLGLILAMIPILPNRSHAAGYADNADDGRPVFLTQIMPNMKVFVDLDSKAMPVNSFGKNLSAEEVREAVSLGVSNWAGVLTGMHFRLVASSDSANLVFRFRNYGDYVPGGSTGVSFLPMQWRPPLPSAGGFDFNCGRIVFGQLPSGKHCFESSNNIILFQIRGLAFRQVDFLDSRMHHEYLSAMTDRNDSSKHFFRFLPDAHYRAWPPDRSTCVTGSKRAGVYPAWDIQCLTDSDWAALPHFQAFGPEQGSYDIAQLVQHELGHAIVGSHTGQAERCLRVTGSTYADLMRDPVYRDVEAIRRAHWGKDSRRMDTDSTSYSVMFSGNGVDAAWNCRGVFEIDGLRLRGGALDWNCLPTGTWKGYLTSYPKVAGWIVLQKPTGETKYVDDWRYAHRLMLWPLSQGQSTASGWFQTGMILKD